MASFYNKCPKCGSDSAGQEVCPGCGLIFAKYLKFTVGGVAPRAASSALPIEDEGTLAARAKELFLHVPEETEPVFIYGRMVALALAALYGVKLAAMDIPSWEMASSLIHYPMVPIHEFGHVLFRPLGEFMTLLGGSLFQILLPLIFGGIFLAKNRDPFAASLMLWWAAVAVMDVAPYVYDAWAPQHVLLSGRTGDTGGHDFIDTLGDLGLLHRAQPIGHGMHAFGVAMLLVALAWGAYMVWRQYRQWKSSTT
jgi:hypothetical protein